MTTKDILNKLSKPLLIGLVVFFAYQWLSVSHKRNQEHKIATNNIEALQSQITTFKNKNGQLVSEKKALVLTNDQLKYINDSLESDIGKLKKLKAKITIKTVTKFDTIEIPVHITDGANCDSCYFTFHKSTKYYDISGYYKKQLYLNSPSFENNITIGLGSTRHKLFGPSELVVRAANSNPYSKTTELNAYTIKYKKKWYEKPWVYIGLGAVGGYLLTK